MSEASFEIDPGRSGEDVTPEQQLLLLEDPNARAARQAAVRAELDYPQPPIRGKKRDLGFELRDDVPTVLDRWYIERLGRILSYQNVPVLDELNRYYSPEPTAEAITNYITFAGRRAEQNKRNREAAQAQLLGFEKPELTDEQKQQARLAKQRKPHIVADGLQRVLRNNTATARVRFTALHNVRTSLVVGSEINPTAGWYAADAIEDLGACLDANQNRFEKGVANSEEIGKEIAYLGYYAAQHLEVLADQPLVLLLAQREQERRIMHWQQRLNAMLDIDQDRRTADDKANEQATTRLIADLAIQEAATTRA